MLLLLDRDGTLMHDVGYPKDPAHVQLLPDAAEAIGQLATMGYVPAVVSNQSGIGRGLITPEQAETVHQRFIELFQQASGVDLPCFYCPHSPDAGCACRKPMPGLLRRAARTLGMEGAPTVMLGDKASDIEAGNALAAFTMMLGNTPTAPLPHAVARNWNEAFRILEYHAETLTPYAA